MLEWSSHICSSSTLYQSGYADDLFKQLFPEVTSLPVDGVEVKLEGFFKDNWKTRSTILIFFQTIQSYIESSLSIEDLRSRRNVLLKEIEKGLRDHDKKTLLVNRKLTLLAKVPLS